MATNKDKLMSGIRFMAIAFPFIFIGPAFMFGLGIPKYRDGSYWALALSIIFMGVAAYFFVRGLRTILSAFFDGR